MRMLQQDAQFNRKCSPLRSINSLHNCTLGDTMSIVQPYKRDQFGIQRVLLRLILIAENQLPSYLLYRFKTQRVLCFQILSLNLSLSGLLQPSSFFIPSFCKSEFEIRAKDKTIAWGWWTSEPLRHQGMHAYIWSITVGCSTTNVSNYKAHYQGSITN